MRSLVVLPLGMLRLVPASLQSVRPGVWAGRRRHSFTVVLTENGTTPSDGQGHAEDAQAALEQL